MTDCKKTLCKKCSRSDTLIYGHAFLPARRKDTGRIPEGCRKGNRHPLSGLLTDLLTGLLTDPLTDLLISGELRQARRLGLPEGYRKDSRSFW